MAIKVIAQRREVKLGKNPGKKFVMRPDLYSPPSRRRKCSQRLPPTAESLQVSSRRLGMLQAKCSVRG